eukprot:COSAG01_NODE_4184_length_5261_cov_27.557342_2_plen_662_part_00
MRLACALLLGAAPAAGRQWVVDSVNGDDTAAGDSPATAFRTLERARSALAEWRAHLGDAQTGELRVLLRQGTYAPLRLRASDGGSSAASVVTWAAYPGEQPVISAGFRVPASAVKTVSNPKRPGTTVQHVALSKLGFTPSEYGALGSGPKVDGCANRKMEAHFGAKALRLARYPNPFTNGTWRWLYVDSPVGWTPSCKHQSRTAPPCGASKQDFVWAAVDSAHVRRWVGETDPWLHGYFQYDWYDTIGRISAIKPGNSTINIDPATPTYGTRPIQKGARWLGLNLLSELDAESEYWLDRESGDLYFIAPPLEARGPESDLVVSVNSTALESNASYMRFEGLTVKYSQGSGMVLNGEHIAVINCSSSHHGEIGILINGTGNTVRGSVVRDVGCAAMAVTSGTRKTLTPGNTTIQDNILHDFSQWKRMYQPGIKFDGVGDRFINNTMYRAPHSGMLGRADNCLFEGNNFTELCTESGDAGAWYSGRSWADRGNAIVGNHFSHIRNTGAPIPLQAQNVHAIHFDDQMSGYEVRGNTIADCWAGIKLGGGRRTVIRNNRFLRTHAAIEFDNRGESWQKSYCDPAQAHTFPKSFYRELDEDFAASAQWAQQFPYLQTIAEDHPCVPIHNNISANVHCKCDTWISATAQQIASWYSTAEGNVNSTNC